MIWNFEEEKISKEGGWYAEQYKNLTAEQEKIIIGDLRQALAKGTPKKGKK